MQQNDIDNILMNRAQPPRAKSDLAERIIHAAVSTLQDKPRMQNVWNELMSMFVLPHPSVAAAAGVILGLMIGIQASDSLVILQQDWSSFLEINEGGWL